MVRGMPSQIIGSDALHGASSAHSVNQICAIPSTFAGQPRARATYPTKRWDVASWQALHERLSLLLALDVPCEIKITIPSGHSNSTWAIRRVERIRGYFCLFGDNFSFHMKERCVAHACVVMGQPTVRCSRVLELWDNDSRVCARISCNNHGMAAPWCDVLDSLIYVSQCAYRTAPQASF